MSGHDQAYRLRQMVQRAVERQQSRVIAIASGKGGTGKSTLAVNMALAMRRRGVRVLLIDADFGLANVDLMLGVTPKHNLAQVLTGEASPAEAVEEGIEGVRFLSGGSGMPELLALDTHTLEPMLSALLQLGDDADMIILDIGAGIGQTVLHMLRAANEAIIVTTPEPTAVMDAYALLKSMAAQPDDLPHLYLVVNRADSFHEAEVTGTGIAALAERNLGLRLHLLGGIATDPGIPTAIKRQQPILVAQPHSPAARDIAAIAGRLLGEPPAGKRGFSAFLQRLVRPVAQKRP